MRRKTKFKMLAILILCAAVLAFVPDDEEAASLQRYCDHVKTWHATDGKHGWPPFRGDDQC